MLHSFRSAQGRGFKRKATNLSLGKGRNNLVAVEVEDLGVDDVLVAGELSLQLGLAVGQRLLQEAHEFLLVSGLIAGALAEVLVRHVFAHAVFEALDTRLVLQLDLLGRLALHVVLDSQLHIGLRGYTHIFAIEFFKDNASNLGIFELEKVLFGGDRLFFCLLFLHFLSEITYFYMFLGFL